MKFSLLQMNEVALSPLGSWEFSDQSGRLRVSSVTANSPSCEALPETPAYPVLLHPTSLSLSSLSLAEVWGILIPVPRVWSAESKPPEHRGSPVTPLSLALLLSSAEIEEIYRMHCERLSTLITERSQLGCLGWDSFQNSLTSAFNSE